MNYEIKIREIVNSVINTLEFESYTIDEDLQSIGMDSILFIKIVVEIEKKFNIEFPDEKLLIIQSNTIKKLCEIVMSCNCMEEIV